MSNFFSIIYIKPNRFTDEKIAIGLIGCQNNIPFFNLNEEKLRFGLKYVAKDLRHIIRKSLKLLSFDINKYRDGLDSLPLFNQEVTVGYLNEVARHKRGKIVYDVPIELDKIFDLDKVYLKYIGYKEKG